MPSWQSRLFLFGIRHTHLLQFRLKPKPIVDTKESLEGFRKQVNRVPKHFGTTPEGLEIQQVALDGLYAEWIQPTDHVQPQTILYFHGGGYVSGTCAAHHIHVTKVVKHFGIRALLFEYRVAPEHRYPAALDDALTAYQFLLNEGIAPSQIVFMGDSAGAGLALATLIALKDKGIALPAAAVALSPWTDLACTGESYQTNADSCLSPEGSWTVFSKHYVGDKDPTHPWISPLYADLAGLPPIQLYVGSDEVMLDDSVRFAQKAETAGVDVSLTIGEGLFHCYPICAPIFPEATEAMNEIRDFIHTHINMTSEIQIRNVEPVLLHP